VSLIAAILYTCTALTGIAVGWSSKRTGERNWHIFTGSAVAGICLMYPPTPLNTVVICVSQLSVLCCKVTFWWQPKRLQEFELLAVP